MTKTVSKRYQSTIKNLFQGIGTVFLGPMILPDDENKVYEVFCVYKLLEWMKERYNSTIYYHGGKNMVIQHNGGKIDKTKYAYFEITDGHGAIKLEVHMNVYFKTLGSHLISNNEMRLEKIKDVDRDFPSTYHELDIIVIENGENDTAPRHDEIILGIECKHHSIVHKRVIREILGVRRELSFFCSSGTPSKLDCILNHEDPDMIRAYPSSILWLAHRNDRILYYESSPEIFGIEMTNWKLP